MSILQDFLAEFAKEIASKAEWYDADNVNKVWQHDNFKKHVRGFMEKFKEKKFLSKISNMLITGITVTGSGASSGDDDGRIFEMVYVTFIAFINIAIRQNIVACNLHVMN